MADHKTYQVADKVVLVKDILKLPEFLIDEYEKQYAIDNPEEPVQLHWKYKENDVPLAHFFKAGYPTKAINGAADSEELTFSLAEHTLIWHHSTLYLGLASLWTNVTLTYKEFREQVANPNDTTILAWLKGKMLNGQINRLPILFAYMALDYKGPRDSVTGEALDHGIAFDGFASYRVALSVEVFPNGQFKEVEQSNIVPMYLRNESRVDKWTHTDDLVEALNYNESDYLNYTDTNWYDDSGIIFRGQISMDCLFMINQADPAAYWDGNAAPKIPLYFGHFKPLGVPYSDRNVTLFGGAAFPIPDMEWKIQPLPPLLNLYWFSGNGLSDLIVRLTKYENRYERHYLSWNAPPDGLKPIRSAPSVIGDKPLPEAEHIRAWNNSSHKFYLYKFNSSLYNQSIQMSHSFVVHEDDGVYGQLSDMILLPAHLVANGDMLEMYNCAVGGISEEFEFIYIDAYSPFTVRPGTTYSPAIVGLSVFQGETK